MTLSTFPSDIFDNVLIFLTNADVLRLVRPLSRNLEKRAVEELTRRIGKPLGCFLYPTVVSRIELAMPAVVKAITFDAVTNRLFVCTLGDTPNECVLYEHLPFELPGAQSWVFTEQHKGRQMQRITLPTDSIEFASFEGPFLVCSSKSDVAVMFDCRNRVLVDLPMGYSGLFASSTGRRMAALYGRTVVVFISPLFYDDVENSDPHTETGGSSCIPSSRHSLTSSRSYESYKSFATSLPTSPTTRSEDAEHDESAPITLIPSFTSPFEEVSKGIITDTFLIVFEADSAKCRVRWLNCSIAEAAGKIEEGTVRERDLPSSFRELGAMHAVSDMRCIIVEAYFNQLILCDFSWNGASTLRAVNLSVGPTIRCLSAHACCQQASTQRRSIDETICCIGVVGNKSKIMIISCDGTLVRHVEAPHSAMVACHPIEPLIISTSDEESLPEHLLLQALEGGYGSLIQFDPTYNNTRLWRRLAKPFPSRGSQASGSDRLSVALIFCYAAVSLALVWTTFALIYNGWWLYMQKLVFVLG